MTLAVFLAGGEGTRLRPLTVSKPKPLVRILNIPVLTYNLVRVRNLGIKEAKITLHYLPQLIISEYGDGSELGLSISYSIEERPLGTAGGVREAIGDSTERILVISGDLITDINLAEMLEFHKKKGASMTIALSYAEEPYQFGIAKLDDEGKITRYLEKPSPSEVFSNYINAGMYILEPEILKYIPRSTEFDFSRDLIPILLSKGESIYGYYSNAFWRDIGTIDQYLKCNYELLNGFSKELYEIALKHQQIAKDIRDLEEPSLVNANSIIKEGARIGPYCVIDEEVTIGRNTILSRSIVSKGAYIGDRCSIISSIIDRYAKINDKVTIFENCVIGERTIIGRGVEIRPNVRIWPDKIIDENLIITTNIVTVTRIPKPLFTQGIARFAINTEISPEFSAKLGRTLGTLLKNKENITISSSSNALLRLIGLSMCSGIISTGANVLYAGVTSAAISRLISKLTQAKYNIYITLNDKNKSEILIYLFDENGYNIEEKIEKKIENTFYREEFKIVDIKNMGFLNNLYLENIIKIYIDILKKILSGNNFIDIYFIINSEFDLITLIDKIKEEGFPVYRVNDKSSITNEKFENSLVVTTNSELSKLEILNKTENINQGKTILLEALASKEIAKKKEIIVPPYLCEEAIDYLRNINFSVKIEDISFREYSKILTQGDIALLDTQLGVSISPMPYFDAILNSLLISALISVNKKQLDNVLKEIPNHYLIHEFEEVPLDKIPKFIQELSKLEKAESYGNKVILKYDSVKCGLMPSILATGIDIIASSVNYEEALRITSIVKKLINRLKAKIL